MVLTHKDIYKNIGISYLIYSHIAAKITRRALKKEFLKDAFSREVCMINISHYKNGVKGEVFIPLQPKVEEVTIDLKRPKKEET
ncbi:unnamed protein product [Ceutorhynchus assimilis]|uniref:Uncharacterized protein n=1 Tax=Ceutorhynchus assimilis TaxID=467358 RepID=A0A9N9QRN0_9CUCU|nr:unnamed protein product [Ceutorhynchus assimilis]